MPCIRKLKKSSLSWITSIRIKQHLYKKYLAAEARRIIKHLEIHYTPKHGSWLDIAEIERNVMTRQCLSRRNIDINTLRNELPAWRIERNVAAAKVNWQFKTTDARIKLKSLYPKFTTASEQGSSKAKYKCVSTLENQRGTTDLRYRKLELLIAFSIMYILLITFLNLKIFR